MFNRYQLHAPGLPDTLKAIFIVAWVKKLLQQKYLMLLQLSGSTAEVQIGFLISKIDIGTWPEPLAYRARQAIVEPGDASRCGELRGLSGKELFKAL